MNSPEVKEWENGRRPSLFTALAKLRGMKNRARANSTDSVHSTHSNISAMSSADNKSDNNNNNNVDTNNGLLSVSISNHHSNNNNNKSDDINPVSSPITPLDKIDLHILKEVSNETDDDNILAVTKNKNQLDLNHLSKHIASDTKDKSDNDEDPITPLEVYNNSFPETSSTNTTMINNKSRERETGSKPIKIISTQL